RWISLTGMLVLLGLIAYAGRAWLSASSSGARSPLLSAPLLHYVSQNPAKNGANREPARIEAPELEGGIAWLNTSGPIRLRDLRGKIVLLDFWTFCCINCIHTLPELAKLEKKYADQLIVVGIHSAKFENERNSESIRKAILRYEITHPVVN